ncbi:MAG: tyrosine-protein phosphatase [Spirochaetota bacterium]
MDRVRNFRELGGYRTVDGKTVRAGMLFRSGHLSRASRADLAAICNRHIAAIVDFRSEGERRKAPGPDLADCGIRTVALPVLDHVASRGFAETAQRIRSRDFRDSDVDSIMIETNRDFALEWTAEFGAFLRLVIESRGTPILWHCTGGKDRTGFAAALILRLLGVDDETIVEDYLISRSRVRLGRPAAALLAVTRGVRVARSVTEITMVRSRWIRAALAATDEWPGGFEAYRRDALGVGDDDINILKAALLE